MSKYVGAGSSRPYIKSINKGTNHAKQKINDRNGVSRSTCGSGSVHWRQNAKSKSGSDGVGTARGKRRNDVNLDPDHSRPRTSDDSTRTNWVIRGAQGQDNLYSIRFYGSRQRRCCCAKQQRR